MRLHGRMKRASRLARHLVVTPLKETKHHDKPLVRSPRKIDCPSPRGGAGYRWRGLHCRSALAQPDVVPRRFDGIRAASPGSAVNLRKRMHVTGTIAPADVDEWAHSEGERVFEPRECDFARGVSTACLFMD